jgi:Tfp pilus assembly protein PilX
MTHHKTQSGFALLMTLLVVAVVVSITATIIELTLKQLALSVTAKDSEIAFHAANAGMECARYVRRYASTTIENPSENRVNFECFGQTNQRLDRRGHSLNVSGGNGLVHYYEGEVSWGSGDRCSQVDMVTMIVDETATGDMTINNFNSMFAGFPASKTKACPPGGICTVAEVTGFNRPCGSLLGSGVVRREILLEF